MQEKKKLKKMSKIRKFVINLPKVMEKQKNNY